MLGLDIGNGRSDRRCYCACYGLLERGVHDLRVSCDFLETGNCFKELVCVCEPRGVVKTREKGCCCSCFSLGDAKKRGIYWLGSSYAIDEFLEGGIDARSLTIACVALELVDGTGKALGFCWKGEKSHSLKNEERKEKKNYYVWNKWALVSCSGTKGKTVLSICQGDNLVGGRIDDLLKVGIVLSK